MAIGFAEAAGELFDLAAHALTVGGSEKESICVPLARYLEERAEADAMMTQQVTRDCSDAGLASYLAAAARSLSNKSSMSAALSAKFSPEARQTP